VNERRAVVAYYLAAILAVTGFGVAALVVLEVVRGEVDRGLVAQVIAIVLPTLAALLALLRTEVNAQVLRELAAHQREIKDVAQQNKEEIVNTLKAAMTESQLARPTNPAPMPYRDMP
jgi:hypothetical protein